MATKYKMKMRKKGVFLTFISIAVIAAVLVIFIPSNISLKKDASAIRARVSNVNDYVFDLENVYLKKALQASGRRAIISLIEDMKAKQVFLAKFESAFAEAMVNGKLDNQPLPLMNGNNYNDLVNGIVATAEGTFNVQTKFESITPKNVSISQMTPWYLIVEINVSFSVMTAENTASWNRSSTITEEISIENFEDPYYIVKSEGKYSNIIKRTGTLFDEWTVAKVIDFITNGDYTHFEEAKVPSFISRFTGSIEPSDCCGIESLVNPNKLGSLGLPKKDASYADYLYWSATASCADSPLTLYRDNVIDSAFPGFKLDLGHISRYKLSADAQICPPPQQ